MDKQVHLAEFSNWTAPRARRRTREDSVMLQTVAIYYGIAAFTYFAVNFALTGLFVHVLIDKADGIGFVPGTVVAAIMALIYKVRLKRKDVELYQRDAIIFYPLAILSVGLIASGFCWGLLQIYDRPAPVALFAGCHAAVVIGMLLMQFCEIRSLKY